MKRATVALLVLVIVSIGVSAQSLLDDPNYKALVDRVSELQSQAQQAIDDGEYDKAVELANEAEQVSAQAEEYATNRVLGYRANSWLARAKERMAFADSVNASERYPDEYALATQHLADAQTAFDAGDYQDAITASKNVMTALENVKRPAVVVAPEPEPEPVVEPEPEPEPEPVVEPEPEPEPEPVVAPEPTLPRYYIVRLIPDRRDCFWRIAEYDFVYGDPWQWQKLYEANKEKMPDPENPDLILPGMIIEIPSLDGETREGTWNPEDAISE